MAASGHASAFCALHHRVQSAEGELMGKLQSNRKSPVHRRQGRPTAPKVGATGSRPGPSLGFPTISLDELARRQGVKAITNLEEFASAWPAEFGPDELLAWLSAERKTRRQTATQTRPASA